MKDMLASLTLHDLLVAAFHYHIGGGTDESYEACAKQIEMLMVNRTVTLQEGFAIVPVVPTGGQSEAADDAHNNKPLSDWGKIVPASDEEIYVAMVDHARRTVAQSFVIAIDPNIIPVAEVADGPLGNRLMWATSDAQEATAIGTRLYAARPPEADQSAKIAELTKICDDYLRIDNEKAQIAQLLEAEKETVRELRQLLNM